MITIRGFLICFLIWCSGYHGCLCITSSSCILLGYIIHDYSSLFPACTPLWIYADFIGIFLAGLQDQTWFPLMFLTMFFLTMFLCYMRVHFLYKY